MGPPELLFPPRTLEPSAIECHRRAPQPPQAHVEFAEKYCRASPASPTADLEVAFGP